MDPETNSLSAEAKLNSWNAILDGPANLIGGIATALGGVFAVGTSASAIAGAVTAGTAIGLMPVAGLILGVVAIIGGVYVGAQGALSIAAAQAQANRPFEYEPGADSGQGAPAENASWRGRFWRSRQGHSSAR